MKRLYRNPLSGLLLLSVLSVCLCTNIAAQEVPSATTVDRWRYEPMIVPRAGRTRLSESKRYDAHPSSDPDRLTIGIAIIADQMQGDRQDRYLRYSLFLDESTDDVLDHTTTGVGLAHGWRRFRGNDPWRYVAVQLGTGLGVLKADNDQDKSTHAMLELQASIELGLRRVSLGMDAFARQHASSDFNGDELAPFTYGLRWYVGFRVGRRATALQ